MNEFEFITYKLKPLANSFAGALNLEDDAAILKPEKGKEFVITTDALTAGVHFLRQIHLNSLPKNACALISLTSPPWARRRIVTPSRSCYPIKSV